MDVTVYEGVEQSDALSELAIALAEMSADGRRGVSAQALYTALQTRSGSAASLIRYAPGAAADPHRHTDYELIYVLDGVLELGGLSYGLGSLLVLPPGSVHAPRSDSGCFLLVVWEGAVDVLHGPSTAGPSD